MNNIHLAEHFVALLPMGAIGAAMAAVTAMATRRIDLRAYMLKVRLMFGMRTNELVC
jgi:hypothetical protein